mmetsp:Transcript_18389/g.53430  ORF Transcript_18389/g.53430 Transcript_18389/m.53430 type:complete len:168 (-) Transcript_18389:171-674(-)
MAPMDDEPAAVPMDDEPTAAPVGDEPVTAPAPQEAGAAEGPEGPPAEASGGPPAVTVQFIWGTETFRRTDRVECGRFVYKTRGTVDGKGGLILGYAEHEGGCWELGSISGGCLYRFQTDAKTPAGLVGCRPWTRRSGGGTCNIVVMQRAAETNGWVDPALLAFDRRW